MTVETYEICCGKYHHATELHKTTVHIRWQDTWFPDLNLDQSRHASM